MRTLLALFIGTAVMAGTAGTAGAQGLDPKKVDAGQKVYVTHKCSACHAIKNSGGKMASALGGVGAKLTEADISATDVDVLVAFLMSQK